MNQQNHGPHYPGYEPVLHNLKLNDSMGLSTFWLKMIAVITMAIDHVGAVLFPNILVLRIIGRLAFPIFCYLLVEGSFYTRDIKKYLVRLFLFALISEIPFDLALFGALSWQHQNVMVTLFLGLTAIALIRKYQGWFNSMLISVAAILLAELVKCDYAGAGVLLILIFYFFRSSVISRNLFAIMLLCLCFEGIEGYAIISLLLITFSNGEQGPKCKHFFYWFYPVHLSLLFLIKYIWF